MTERVNDFKHVLIAIHGIGERLSRIIYKKLGRMLFSIASQNVG